MALVTSMWNHENNQVLFEEHSSGLKVLLNRPTKMNSLTFDMVSDIYSVLTRREDDSNINVVILKGNGRAFCAGGDVARVISLVVLGNWSFAVTFYRKQLILDNLLATYKKPVVAIINGVVMGGGAGLSMHGRFRVTTENAMFAMPETSLGLFPDVGASHFLTRLPGFLGEYLGLTGTRIDGSEMVICGLATHLVLAKDVPSLEEALCKLESSDPTTTAKVIEKFAHNPLIKQDSSWNKLDAINHCFSRNTVEEIISSLEGEVAKGGDKLLTRALVSMKRASPMSLKITLKSIRHGRKETLKECLSREYTMSANIVRKTVNADFFEGARAMIFEKDKNPKFVRDLCRSRLSSLSCDYPHVSGSDVRVPLIEYDLRTKYELELLDQWEPSTLELVTEKMVDQLFIAPVHDDNWVPIVFPDRRSNPVVATNSKL